MRLRLVFLIMLGAGLCLAGGPKASADTCTALCDCPQGQFCYYGTCISDPKLEVYCCSKPGCVPGSYCYDTSNVRSTCAEDPDYVCQDACDCGPATACLDVPGVGKTCVRDQDDPWLAGDSIFGVTVPAGEPTYCCSATLCDAGRSAYSNLGQAADFRCFDAVAGVARDYCTGTECYFANDCDPGESCIDTRTGSTAKAGTSCSTEGGFCKSNAVAEVVYNWSSSDLTNACSPGSTSGAKCEAGWRPGGAYAVQRVVATAGSCGNGTCEAWETAVNCAEDCHCGDGVCDTTEVGTCAADCGTCGDGLCGSRETPKTCPSDCPVTCGDGSCDASEVTSCPQDCGCPASPTYADAPIWCGDGVCQTVGDIPENCVNCPTDCPGSSNDADGDGIADCIDNCPAIYNPSQANLDGDTQGDACDDDDDNDGVLDAQDQCAQTPPGSVVGPNGCSVGQTCPCANPWKNHGAYIYCVARTAESLLGLGLIDQPAKDALVSAAAASACGR